MKNLPLLKFYGQNIRLKKKNIQGQGYNNILIILIKCNLK